MQKTGLFKIFIFILLSLFFYEFAFASEPCSIVLLPDTQYYSENYPQTYEAQTEWIADNADTHNIQFVIHLGDITDDNTDSQWQVADDAHTILDQTGIPYSMVPGNHDNPEHGRKRSTVKYNQYFGVSRFADKTWYGGNYQSKNDNNYTYFYYNDLKFMVLSLEFAPRKDVLDWANQIIKLHHDYRIIVVTHCYQTHGGGHQKGCACEYNLTGSCGEVLWNELIRRHSNIFMVLSGHIADSEHKVRTGLAGNKVHEILTDYQSEPNGGNGWLRLVTFYPDENLIEFKSVSVLGVTEFSHDQYNSNPDHNDHYFTLSYNMSEPPNYSYIPNDSGFSDRTVNSTSSGQQLKPDIAMDSDGEIVVVWEDDKDGNGVYQIRARGFYADGFERFHDITVNSVANGQQLKPDIAMDSDGDFVVVWQDDQDENDVYQIMARGFCADGSERFHDRTVNSVSNGQQCRPDIAMDSDGNFVVVWQDDQDGNGVYQIMARGFYADGSERFHDRTVNSVSKDQQIRPDVAMDSDGNFVVVWQDDQDGNGVYQIMARGFYADGSERFHDRTVNSMSKGQQMRPDIAMGSDGNFVVVWQDDRDSNGVYQIMARGFYADGSERFHDRTVNECSNGQQYLPAVGFSQTSNIAAVVWEDDKDQNTYFEILMRGFPY